MKLYTWEDLCDYELMLLRKWQLAYETRLYEPYRHNTIDDYSKLQIKMRNEEINAINNMIKELGIEITEERWEELKNG